MTTSTRSKFYTEQKLANLASFRKIIGVKAFKGKLAQDNDFFVDQVIIDFFTRASRIETEAANLVGDASTKG